MLLNRLLNLPDLLQKKSFFLFGPRATGKTSIIKQQLKDSCQLINLLHSEYFLNLSAAPHKLENLISSAPENSIIVIDEVQRVPELLNEVHRLIEDQQRRFLLTGSSARRLKQGDVNLLAGRAWEARLFPLCYAEIPNFDLNRYLLYGGLPAIYLSDYPDEELNAYISTYLKEEIQAEALVRKIAAFTRFLQFSSLTSGQTINFTQLGSDAGVPPSTVREHYQLLEDTFVGFMLPAFTATKKRKAISTARFYYFDLGVQHKLAGITSIPESSDLFGRAFEHFIALELRSFLSYSRLQQPLRYWRSTSGMEVDFILGDQLAIEVKSTSQVKGKHFKGLAALKEEGLIKRHLLISQDKLTKQHNDIEAWYWEDFLKALWAGELISA